MQISTLSWGDRNRLRAWMNESFVDDDEFEALRKACKEPYYPLSDCHEVAAAARKYLDDPEGEPQ